MLFTEAFSFLIFSLVSKRKQDGLPASHSSKPKWPVVMNRPAFTDSNMAAVRTLEVFTLFVEVKIRYRNTTDCLVHCCVVCTAENVLEATKRSILYLVILPIVMWFEVHVCRLRVSRTGCMLARYDALRLCLHGNCLMSHIV